MRDANCSDLRIADYLNRNNSTISRFIKGQTQSNNQKRSGRRSKISEAHKRVVDREDIRAGECARDVRDSLNLTISVRTILRVLQNCQDLTWSKYFSQPALSRKAMITRCHWAGKYVNLGEED